MRGFEIVQDFAIKYDVFDIVTPIRATRTSAGYDFYSPIDITIESGKSELIWTNIKSSMNADEYLMLCTTSGMGKNGLIISQGVGIIDSDYYNNPNNDGNIGFRISNYSDKSYSFAKGDKIGQGIFVKYLTCDNDNFKDVAREGGFGSTVNK